jgi:hypothetical protein
LDALNKARNVTNLDQGAVWSLTQYLQGAWEDTPGKNIRPFDLGQVLSNFFVDLSLRRLPEKITKQSPQTEPQLLNFFGGTEGSKSHFWAQCVEIWNVTLEPDPAYAREVKQYLDMLLHASLQEKRLDPAAAPIMQPVEPFKKTSKAHVAVPVGNEAASVSPAQVPAPKDPPEPNTLPGNAYLVMQDTRVIPLDRPFIKIGRRSDNHIILKDPRVSRSHAQIKLINDRYVIFDMNSTGGTFVNGQPTSQSVLNPGDIVSLAGVVFLFSQDMPARPGDMKIIELGNSFSADQSTGIIHRKERRPARKIGPKNLPDLPKAGT